MMVELMFNGVLLPLQAEDAALFLSIPGIYLGDPDGNRMTGRNATTLEILQAIYDDRADQDAKELKGENYCNIRFMPKPVI